MPIQVLPDALVARIAAGEVVERPSSAVKELIENAIDAGATDIRVECIEGGKRLIRITDDGNGIPTDEVALAFQHHATSKLSSADELSDIHTLGFRGEALASIASVSQVTCVTRHNDETSGTLIRLDNGHIVTHERIGRTSGTTMTIEHVFSRVPARLKFLKSNQTERGHIDGIVTRYAMAYPHIRFTLVHDGKLSFQSLGTGNLRDVLVEVYGADAAGQMVRVETETGAGSDSLDTPRTTLHVSGFVALPTLDHSNRTKIVLFVNGRPVQDTKLSYAVVQAFHTLLMTGRYPIATILVQVPPQDVDVNVHPAKAEVRFREADAVFGAVQRAVRRTLLENMAPPQPPSVLQKFGTESGDWGKENVEGSTQDAGRTMDDVASGVIEPQPRITGSDSWDRIGIARQHTQSPLSSYQMPPTSNSASGQLPLTSRQLPALRILGQLAATYILAEGPEGLYLIDQHAAHERILWERMMTQLELGNVPSQALLDPVPVTVPAESAHLLEDQLTVLRDAGFDIEGFGGNTFLVRSVPALMIQDDITNAVREIVGDLEMGDVALRKELEAKVLRRVCKRMAIKAGRVLSFAEMAALVRDLEQCESPRTCPHGRPTMIQIGVTQLDREFGRLG
jgi:DNA mismatch repair protein MutL